MAKSYEQIQAQIEALQQKAAAARKKELDGVIKEIQQAIDYWGLTADDLGLSGSTKSAATKKAGRKTVAKKGAAKKSGKKPGKATSAPKYGDGNGNTWSGRGPRPGWLRAALESGRTLEEFLV